MSSKKGVGTSTKDYEDENTDSGFLSGELSGTLTSSECLDVEDRKQEFVEHPQLDSGLELCLSESLASVSLTTCPEKTTPTITVQETSQDSLPLRFLYQQDDDGDTQLHIAAVHGCEKSIGTLIRICPDKSWLNIPNDYGHTALHLASMSGHAVVARMLIMAGASLGVRDVTGSTALHLAATAGYSECLQALLAPVPEHPHRKIAAVLRQKDYNGQTCVHLASMAGHMDTLQTLIFYGADINVREGLGGWTALHIAAARGDLRLAKFLLEKCPGVAKDAMDYSGRSAARIAKKTAAAPAFASVGSESETESDSEDDMLLEAERNLFDKFSDNMTAIKS